MRRNYYRNRANVIILIFVSAHVLTRINSMANLKRLRTKYEAIARLLADRYGYPTWRQHLPPVDELVDTILSQNTSDINRSTLR